MQPTINVITLAVSDLDRALTFYRDGLGLDSPGVVGTEFTGDETNPGGAVVMFRLSGGLVLALYPRTELAKDANVTPHGDGFRATSLALNTRSRDEVDSVLKEAESAGAKIVKPAQEAFWGGYSGYFSDPDGFLWEVAWSPFFAIAEDGSLRIPE